MPWMDGARSAALNAGTPKHDVFAKQSGHDLDDRRVRTNLVECPRAGRMALVPIQRGPLACVTSRPQKSLALLCRKHSDGARTPLLGNLGRSSLKSAFPLGTGHSLPHVSCLTSQHSIA